MMKQTTGTIHIAAQDFNATTHSPRSSAAPRNQGLWGWLWGKPAAHLIEPPSLNVEDDSTRAQDGLPPEKSDADWGVVVQKPARTALDAFKDTISEGTRLFCEQNVHPLYVEDKQTKFRVTGIKMYAPAAASQLISIIENLPIDVRNRMAKLRAQNAPGAAEQLVFDDSFFGISLDIAPAVIDGQQIRLIAAWTGGSVEIKLVFTGQYITVKPVSEPAYTPPPAPAPAPQDPGAESCETDQALTAATASTDRADSIAATSPDAGHTLHADVSKPGKDTPLGQLPSSTPKGSQTPMSEPGEKVMGRIHILPYGAVNETLINITASMLPYMLGREHTSTGRFAHGYSLASERDEAVARLVSREHFELNKFEANEGRFYVVNHAVERNGSYFNGCAVPERFSFRAEAPKNTFTLGGAEGAGTVRITIEAV